MPIYLETDPDIDLIPQGVSKQYIIDRAYEDCGLNGFVFQRTPDEDARALAQLNTMMLEHPWSAMGYDAYGENPAEPSGLSASFLPSVIAHLALRLAPGMGKALSPEAAAVRFRAWHTMMAATAVAPPAIKTR